MELMCTPSATIEGCGIMYSEHHYISRSVLAEELALLPENAQRKRAYLELAARWRKLAAAVAGGPQPI
jgi:hypothetical protein